MTGLNATMDRMTAATNNLANASTTAFKAQQPVFQARPLYGQGLADRVDVTTAEVSADFAPGPIEQTGQPLDVAINGQGWIAVQAADGSTALTRNGSLSVSQSGVLETSDGNPVLGSRAARRSHCRRCRTSRSARTARSPGALAGSPATEVTTLNRILLTKPPNSALTRRSDGLFQDQAGAPTPDASVKLQVGALEGSNANPVGLMMNMIENTRMFQMQTELMHRC